MEQLRKTNFDFPSCHSETTNSRQVNDVPLVSYSVWGLISTSKPQREDSIHLSLSSSSSCWQREPSAVWDKNQKSSRETLQRRSSSAVWGPHQFSFLLLNHCPFHRAPVVYAQSYVIFLLRPFAAGCVRCFLISCEWRRDIFPKQLWGISLFVVAISPQTDSSHPLWGVWWTLSGSGSNFLTLIFHISKTGTASLLPCRSLPSAHWLKVKY